MIQTGLFYTLTTPAGNLSLNPTNYSGNGLYVQEVSFERGATPATYPRAGASGALLGTTRLGYIRGEFTVLAAADTYANRQTLEDNLTAYVASILDADGTLKWTPQDSSAGRQLSAVRAEDLPIRSGRLGMHREFTIPLVSGKPFVESQTETTTDSAALTASGGGLTFPLTFPLSFTASGGGTLTVPNAGNAPSYPTLQIHGPISGPAVTNSDTGEQIVLTGSVATGDYIELDLFERTVKLNGSTDVRSTLDVASTSWFTIAAGGADLHLSGSSYDSNTLLRVLSRDTWHL